MGNLNSPKLMKYLSGELDKELCGKKWMWEVEEKVEVGKKVESEGEQQVEVVSIPVEKVVEPVASVEPIVEPVKVAEKNKLELDWDMVMKEVIETAGLEKPGEEKPVYAQRVESPFEVGSSESTGASMRATSRAAVRNQRPRLELGHVKKRDKEIASCADLFGMTGFGQYACDHVTAQKLFSTRDKAKPKWAVYGLCILRDEGVCQVCGELLYTQNRVKQWEVIKKVPSRDGGQFSELNCVTVCIDCFKVYNPQKNFFGGMSFEEGWVDMKLYMLRRRTDQRQGSSGLSVNSEEVFSHLRSVKRNFKDKRQVLGQAVVAQFGGAETVDDKLRELFKNYK